MNSLASWWNQELQKHLTVLHEQVKHLGRDLAEWNWWLTIVRISPELKGSNFGSVRWTANWGVKSPTNTLITIAPSHSEHSSKLLSTTGFSMQRPSDLSYTEQHHTCLAYERGHRMMAWPHWLECSPSRWSYSAFILWPVYALGNITERPMA